MAVGRHIGRAVAVLHGERKAMRIDAALHDVSELEVRRKIDSARLRSSISCPGKEISRFHLQSPFGKERFLKNWIWDRTSAHALPALNFDARSYEW